MNNSIIFPKKAIEKTPPFPPISQINKLTQNGQLTDLTNEINLIKAQLKTINLNPPENNRVKTLSKIYDKSTPCRAKKDQKNLPGPDFFSPICENLKTPAHNSHIAHAVPDLMSKVGRKDIEPAEGLTSIKTADLPTEVDQGSEDIAKRTTSTEALLNTSDREFENLSYIESQNINKVDVLTETQQSTQAGKSLGTLVRNKSKDNTKRSIIYEETETESSEKENNNKNQNLVISLISDEDLEVATSRDDFQVLTEPFQQTVVPELTNVSEVQNPDHEPDHEPECQNLKDPDLNSFSPSLAKSFFNKDTATCPKQKTISAKNFQNFADRINNWDSESSEDETEKIENLSKATENNKMHKKDSNFVSNKAKYTSTDFTKLKLFSDNQKLEIELENLKKENSFVEHFLEFVDHPKKANLILFQDTYITDDNDISCNESNLMNTTSPTGICTANSMVKYGLSSLSDLYFLARLYDTLCISTDFIDVLNHSLKNIKANNISPNTQETDSQLSDLYFSIENFVIHEDKENGVHVWSEKAFDRSIFKNIGKTLYDRSEFKKKTGMERFDSTTDFVNDMLENTNDHHHENEDKYNRTLNRELINESSDELTKRWENLKTFYQNQSFHFYNISGRYWPEIVRKMGGTVIDDLDKIIENKTVLFSNSPASARKLSKLLGRNVDIYRVKYFFDNLVFCDDREYMFDLQHYWFWGAGNLGIFGYM